LEELGGEAWFRLGDRDLATHLYRTQRLSEGATLSLVTAEVARALGVAARLLPMSDQPVRTRLQLDSGEEIAFQEYFVRRRHDVAVSAVRFDGASVARPAPGVLAAIEEADMVVICPSNPVLSIGPLLALAGVEEALRRRRPQVVAVSPIVAGEALKGPAGRLLVELGEESSVVGVARRYRHLAATLVADESDAVSAPGVEGLGMACVLTPAVMHGLDEAVALAKVVLDAGRRGIR